MKLVLYHGSNVFFEEPSLSKAKNYKDFGRGFYLTTNIEQAGKWAIRRLEKNNVQSIGYLYLYEFDTDNLKKLNKLELLSYNKEWLDVVSFYRNNVEKHIKYDIIYDRMADGHYRELVDKLQKYHRKQATVEEVLKVAAFKDTKKDQYCYKTENALTFIHRMSYAEVYNLDGNPEIIQWHNIEKGE